MWTHRDFGCIHKICTGSNQTKALHREVDTEFQQSPTLTKELLQLRAAESGESDFSSGVTVGVSTTLWGKLDFTSFLVSL